MSEVRSAGRSHSYLVRLVLSLRPNNDMACYPSQHTGQALPFASQAIEARDLKKNLILIQEGGKKLISCTYVKELASEKDLALDK